MSPAEALNTTPGNGKKVVLIVDDEASIREFLATYLSSKNFRVLTAPSGEAALEIWAEHQGTIDLLLTDVIMPGMPGTTLAARLREEYPSLKVIFMSGYLPQEIAEETTGEIFFKKPFQPSELLKSIHEALH